MWIKIKDLPFRFFKKKEFERITDDLEGGLLMEVDPRSGNHYDFSVLRMRVGVCDRDIVPSFRKMRFNEVNGAVTFYTLFYEIEDDLNLNTHDEGDNDNKRKKYWRETRRRGLRSKAPF
jgi:hypothetical protein